MASRESSGRGASQHRRSGRVWSRVSTFASSSSFAKTLGSYRNRKGQAEQPDTDVPVEDLLGSRQSAVGSRGGQGTLIATGSDTGCAKMWYVERRSGTGKEGSSRSSARDGGPFEVTLKAFLGGAGEDADSSRGSESRWPGHQAAITSLSFPTCGRVLTSSKDWTATMWNWEVDQTTSKFQSSCVRRYPRSSRDKAIEEARLKRKGSSVGQKVSLGKEGHTAGVNMASWVTTPTGQELVVTCSDDHTAIIWDAKTGCKQKSLSSHAGYTGKVHAGPVPMATWNGLGTKVLTCSYDHTCILWDVAKDEIKSEPFAGGRDARDKEKLHTGPIWCASFSPASDLALTAGKDGRVKVWDLHTCEYLTQLSTFEKHTQGVVQAMWNRFEPWMVLSCSLDQTARLHDTRLPQWENEVAVVGGEKRVIEEEVEWLQHRACVWSASFGSGQSKGRDRQGLALDNPDENLVITASHDMTAALYDWRRPGKPGKPLKKLLGHSGVLWHAALSDDGTIALTASDDGTARVWDLTAGGEYPTSTILAEAGGGRTHDMGVTCAGFAPEPPAGFAAGP